MSAGNSKSGANWPRRLNLLLIGVGVIVFGLIIGDRLMSVFKREQATAIQTTSIDRVSSGSAEIVARPEIPGANDDSGTPIERDADIDTHSEFRSQLVFVSLSEPKYVVTADRQRYYIGSTVGEDTVLADVTGEQLILDRDGTLTAVELQDSSNR